MQTGEKGLIASYMYGSKIGKCHAEEGWQDVKSRRSRGQQHVHGAESHSPQATQISKMSADALEDYCSCPITQASLLCQALFYTCIVVFAGLPKLSHLMTCNNIQCSSVICVCTKNYYKM